MKNKKYIKFSDWKKESRKLDTSKLFVSFNGETEVVTIKKIKNATPRK